MVYALVKDGAIIRQQAFDDTPPSLSPNKGEWLPLVQPPKPSKPSTDAATEVLSRRVKINPNNVVITFTAQDRSIEEAKSRKKAQVTAEALSRVGELPALTDFEIYDAARAAHIAIDGLPNIQSVKAFNVTTGPLWP
jgi:hypothetical protein